MRNNFLIVFGVSACISMLAIIWMGCEAAREKTGDNGRNPDNGGDADSDTDADGDSDADADGDSEADLDSDADDDSGWEITPDAGIIELSCKNCPAVGNTLENLLCAIDLCDDEVVLSQEYTSLTYPNRAGITRAAVERFGNANNDLKPLMNNSYALMATGKARGKEHNLGLHPLLEMFPKGIKDPYATGEAADYKTYDIMEWRINLKAPDNAHGFRIHYVFFSVEYDEYIGSGFDDKFYIFLDEKDGTRNLINFTKCRDSDDPNGYSDFVCTDQQAASGICEKGEKYCYIAVNTAFSECCWHQGCPDGTAQTNIGGTGFECGDESVDYIGDYSMGFTYGSSTGWLVTEWPIEPGQEFTIIFHIHDTWDELLDSEVILDKFIFIEEANPGTAPVV